MRRTRPEHGSIAGRSGVVRAATVAFAALVAVVAVAEQADAQCRRRASRVARPKMMRPLREAPTTAPAKIIQVEPRRRIAVPPLVQQTVPSGGAEVARRPAATMTEVAPAFSPIAGAAVSMLASVSNTAAVVLALASVDWTTSTAPAVEASGSSPAGSRGADAAAPRAGKAGD